MWIEHLYQVDPAPAVQRLLCGTALDLPMALLTTAGEGWFLALLVVALAWRTNAVRRLAAQDALRGLAGLAATGVLANAIKRIAHTPRPLQALGPEHVRVLLEPLRSLSFPSGHSAAAAAFAWWAFRSVPARWRAWPWILAFLVGLSRVYVGAHWVTDVVAGWTLGVAVAALLERLWPRPRGAGAPPTEADA